MTEQLKVGAPRRRVLIPAAGGAAGMWKLLICEKITPSSDELTFPFQLLPRMRVNDSGETAVAKTEL